MSGTRNFVRIREKGRVTLPASVGKRLRLEKGDLVTFVETPEGPLITPQYVVAMDELLELA